MSDTMKAVLGAVGGLGLLIGGIFFGQAADPLPGVDSDPSGSPGVSDRCPDGWEYSEITDHIRVESCVKGSIVAILYPQEKIANYGRNTAAGGDAPAPEIPCLNIPNWPADRCAPQ